LGGKRKKAIDQSAHIRKRYECPLRKIRLKQGMLQRELSLKCDIPISTLSQIEAGKIFPTTYNLILLRDALGCSLEDLIVRRRGSRQLPGGRALLDKVYKKRGDHHKVSENGKKGSSREATRVSNQGDETTDRYERVPIPPDEEVQSRLCLAG
jgi:transcriptional regulator with XRE-family HTH domain